MAKTIPSCDAAGTLRKKTLALLQADKRDLIAIAAATDLPYHWLKKFKEAKHSASVDRVQYLFEKLSGKKLAL